MGGPIFVGLRGSECWRCLSDGESIEHGGGDCLCGVGRDMNPRIPLTRCDSEPSALALAVIAIAVAAVLAVLACGAAVAMGWVS